MSSLETLHRNLCSLTQAHNARDVFRSGTAGTLVSSSIKKRLKLRSLRDVERSHPLRRVNLVSGNCQRVAADLLHINLYFCCGLHCIGVKINISFGSNLSNFLDWLQHSSFVVR